MLHEVCPPYAFFVYGVDRSRLTSSLAEIMHRERNLFSNNEVACAVHLHQLDVRFLREQFACDEENYVAVFAHV